MTVQFECVNRTDVDVTRLDIYVADETASKFLRNLSELFRAFAGSSKNVASNPVL